MVKPEQRQNQQDGLRDLQAALQDTQREAAAAQAKDQQDGLRDLQAALQDTQREAAAAQAKFRQYTDKAAALQRALADAAKSKEMLGKEHDTILKELEESRKARESVLEELKSQLSDSHRAEIDKAIEQVNADIEARRAEVEKLQKEASAAEIAANQAKNDLDRVKTAFEATQAHLKQLPAKMSAARDKAAKLRAAMKSAFDTGKATEAYVLARELGDALAEGQRLSDPTTQSTLLDELKSQWDSLSEATQKASDSEVRWEEKKQSLSAKEQELQQAEKGRDAALRKRLEAIIKPETSLPTPTPRQQKRGAH